MKSAIVHGVLLVVMLVYGYRTWTRDQTVKPTAGQVVLWNKTEAEVQSVVFTSDKKIVKIENKGGYFWGSETTIEKKAAPTPPVTPAPGSGSGSGSGSDAGSGSGSGSGSAGSGSAAPAPEPQMVETRKTSEFPLGDGGTKLVTSFVSGRAIRDLGVPNDKAKDDYKLKDAKNTIAVTFKGGETKTFLLGGTVYGDSSRYAIDQATGKAYVLAKEYVQPLESGKSALQLGDPRGFDEAKMDTVVINGAGADAGKSKTVTHVTNDVEGSKVKTWGDAATKKADATLANFIDNLRNLRPTEYAPEIQASTLTPIMTIVYKDEASAQLGTMNLYKREKPGELPEGQELDPANPPKGETVYYIVTEKTRVPAIVRNDIAQRAETDLPVIFGDKPAPAPTPTPTPTPPPAMGSGSAAGSGSGSAAGSGSGSGSAAISSPPTAPLSPHSTATPVPMH